MFPGELLGHFKQQTEQAAKEGDERKRQINNTASRIVEKFILLQQQAEQGKPIDENEYWELRGQIHGGPFKPSLLEKTAGENWEI